MHRKIALIARYKQTKPWWCRPPTASSAFHLITPSLNLSLLSLSLSLSTKKSFFHKSFIMYDIAALDLSQDEPLSFDTRRYLVGLAIQSLYQDVAVITEPVLEDRHIATLPIRIMEWDLTHQEGERTKSEDISFFEPMSEADYSCYRIVATREAKFRLKGYKGLLDKPPCGISALRIAYCLCTSLVWIVNGAHRAGIPKSEHGHERSLGSLTGWLHQE